MTNEKRLKWAHRTRRVAMVAAPRVLRNTASIQRNENCDRLMFAYHRTSTRCARCHRALHELMRPDQCARWPTPQGLHGQPRYARRVSLRTTGIVVYKYGMRFVHDDMCVDRTCVARGAICCGLAAYNVLKCVV